jgi:gamma-glutamylcyclotransferase (GGCT)/AIG2-like uncharacterized protein YtfP
MTKPVFTYGTLMFPPVWHAVTGRFSCGVRAVLADHARHALRGRTYPGLVESLGQSVEGILYQDVDEAILQRLDAFEGAEYERVEVTVAISDGRHAALAYRLAEEARREIEPADWDPTFFAPRLEAFLTGRSTPRRP